MSNNPIFRLYNPHSGNHHFTASRNEYDTLGTIEWIREGLAWYGEDDSGVALFRFFNPNASGGTHHYTSSTEERVRMVSDGWVYEGISWYGVNSGPYEPTVKQSGWVNNGGATFYGDKNGNYVRSWQQIDGNTYYFDKKGCKTTGAADASGTIYDFGVDGKLQHG